MTELDLRTLSDCELRVRLRQLAAGERRISGHLLRHLAEYDRRGLCREDGHSNLWTYCAKELKFSEAEINLRIQAARAIAANPELLGMLDRGETTISSIGRLAPHLKSERKQELIEQVKGKTYGEVRWLVATEKALEKAQEAEVAARQEAAVQAGLFDGGKPSIDRARVMAEVVEDFDRIVPLSGDRARLEAVVSRDFVKRL